MMKRYELHMLGRREPIYVELDCLGIEELAELASQSRFVIGHLADIDECGCQPKVMVAAQRIFCAIETSS